MKTFGGDDLWINSIFLIPRSFLRSSSFSAALLEFLVAPPMSQHLLRPRFHRGHGAPQGGRRTDNHLLRLHDEEENQAAQEEAWPDPKRDRFVVEQNL